MVRSIRLLRLYRNSSLDVNRHLVLNSALGLCQLYQDKARKDRVVSGGSSAAGAEIAASVADKTNLSSGAASTRATKKPASLANPYARKAGPVSNPYIKKSTVSNPYAKPSSVNPYAKAHARSTSTVVPTVAADDPTKLWVDKHAPQETREILGNKDHVQKLTSCKAAQACSLSGLFLVHLLSILLRLFFELGLSNWERNFLNPKTSGKTFSSPKGPWKAALLSGPPGIGSKWK